LNRLSKSKQSLSLEEQSFWRDVNQYERNLLGFQDSLSSATAQIESLKHQYDRLKAVNVIGEVFTIGTAEELGTIGGFRLGRLPMTEVKVDEINAAMGHSVYMMCVLAHRFGFKLDVKFDIILCGAYCRIALKQSPSLKYELYLGSNIDRYNTAL
jgi:beclin 1